MKNEWRRGLRTYLIFTQPRTFSAGCGFFPLFTVAVLWSSARKCRLMWDFCLCKRYENPMALDGGAHIASTGCRYASIEFPKLSLGTCWIVYNFVATIPQVTIFWVVVQVYTVLARTRLKDREKNWRKNGVEYFRTIQWNLYTNTNIIYPRSMKLVNSSRLMHVSQEHKKVNM